MMFSSGTGSFFSQLGRRARLGQSWAWVVASVAAVSLGLGSSSFGVISGMGTSADVTAITAKLTTGTSTTIPNLSGYGASYSVFKTSNTYALKYLSQDDAIQTVTAGAL